MPVKSPALIFALKQLSVPSQPVLNAKLEKKGKHISNLGKKKRGFFSPYLTSAPNWLLFSLDAFGRAQTHFSNCSRSFIMRSSPCCSEIGC